MIWEDVECPFCKHEFNAEEWEDGECPKCKEEYFWDEFCLEDYSDCWAELHWTTHHNKLLESWRKSKG